MKTDHARVNNSLYLHLLVTANTDSKSLHRSLDDGFVEIVGRKLTS